MEKEEKEDANGTENSGTLAASHSSSSVSPDNQANLLNQLIASNPAFALAARTNPALALAASANPAFAAMAAAVALNNVSQLNKSSASPNLPKESFEDPSTATVIPQPPPTSVLPPSILGPSTTDMTTPEKSGINSIHSQDKSPFLANGNMPFGKPPPTQLLAPELRVEDKTYELKDGWGKRVTQRTSGSSMGKFDVYLTNPISTKRLRSIPELLKFIKDNPYCPIDPTVVNMDDPAKFPPGKFSKATEKFIKAVIEMKSGQEITEVDQRWRQKLFNEAPEPAKPKTPKTPKEPKAPKEPKTPKAPKTPGSQQERAPKRGPGRPTGYSPLNGYTHPKALNDLSSPEKYTAWVPSSNQYVPQGFSELSESFTHSKVVELEKIFVENVSMPTPEQIIIWAEKLELNPEEVSHWFRCKWRIKLMSPFLQGASNMPPSGSNGSVKTNENGSYSRTDTGSDGAQGDKESDEFISIECETIVEEVTENPTSQEMAVS